MKQLKNAWYIGLKELKIFASDRAALIFSIIFPFFFVTLFYFLFQGIGAQDERITLYVTTQGGPAGASDMLMLYLYNNAFRFYRIDKAAVTAVFIFVVLLAFGILQRRLLAGRRYEL